jgi:anti-anti-sigma factor
VTPVVEVMGEVDVRSAPNLRSRLDAASRRYRGQVVVVDLSGVTFIDSTGLGVLVGALRSMRSTGGGLCLSGCAPGVARVLSITGLDHVFDVERDGPGRDRAHEQAAR